MAKKTKRQVSRDMNPGNAENRCLIHWSVTAQQDLILTTIM